MVLLEGVRLTSVLVTSLNIKVEGCFFFYVFSKLFPMYIQVPKDIQEAIF